MSHLSCVKPVSSPVPLQELAHGLGELLNYDGNVEEDFYLTFQVSGHSYSRGEGLHDASTSDFSSCIGNHFSVRCIP